MITVKDIWRSALPHETQLLAGGAGLERRVDWATSMRTKPPAFSTIKGGELAFIAVRSIKLLDERLDLSRVMDSFAEKGGVACAVLGDVPKESIELADRLMLPLLHLPSNAHLGEVEHEAIRYILDERTALHDRSEELQSELMDLALSGSGAKPIIERLAQLTALPAVLQRENGEIAESSGATSTDISLWSDAAAEITRWSQTVTLSAANPPVREFPTAKAGIARLVSPVPARHGISGFVSLLGPESSLDQVVRFACARAASACAIEFDRERAVVAAREDVEVDLIAAMLHDNLAGEAAIMERARRFGFDPDNELQVLVIRNDKNSAAPDERWTDAPLGEIKKWAQLHGTAAMAGMNQGAIVVAIENPDSTLSHAISELPKSLDTGSRTFSLGLGRRNRGISGMRDSHLEAEQALRLGTRISGPGSITTFSEMGLHRMLFAIAQLPEVADFYHDTLGILIAYDDRHHADLLLTLDAYFAALCSPTEAAERLRLHRNTVLYRLNRIEKLLGKPLDDGETRLNLQLALRIYQISPH